MHFHFYLLLVIFFNIEFDYKMTLLCYNYFFICLTTFLKCTISGTVLLFYNLFIIFFKNTLLNDLKTSVIIILIFNDFNKIFLPVT